MRDFEGKCRIAHPARPPTPFSREKDLSQKSAGDVNESMDYFTLH
jgi:hypothetical protein